MLNYSIMFAYFKGPPLDLSSRPAKIKQQQQQQKLASVRLVQKIISNRFVSLKHVCK